MANPLPQKDQTLREFANIFHGACAGNLTVLGITSAQLTALNDKFLAFDTTLTDQAAQKVAMKAATVAKDVAKEDLTADLRELIRIIRGRAVPAVLLEELGIGSIDPHQPVQPEQPGTPTVTPFADGVNWVRWQRGTNKKGTQFVVQVNNSETGGWTYVVTTTKTSYRHMNQEPGFQQSYRVYAIRKGVPGQPSMPATVYGPEYQAAVAAQLKVA